MYSYPCITKLNLRGIERNDGYDTVFLSIVFLKGVFYYECAKSRGNYS